MSEHVPFIERALRGRVVDVDEEVDDEIALWHASDSRLKLSEWLDFVDIRIVIVVVFLLGISAFVVIFVFFKFFKKELLL